MKIAQKTVRKNCSWDLGNKRAKRKQKIKECKHKHWNCFTVVLYFSSGGGSGQGNPSSGNSHSQGGNSDSESGSPSQSEVNKLSWLVRLAILGLIYFVSINTFLLSRIVILYRANLLQAHHSVTTSVLPWCLSLHVISSLTGVLVRLVFTSNIV